MDYHSVRDHAWGVLSVAFQGVFFVGREFLLILRNQLSQCILLGCHSTVNYYQAPHRVFWVTLVLQVLAVLWITLTADLETPLKRFIKIHSSLKARQFLVNVLNVTYFDCSNPIEKKVMKTDIILLPSRSIYLNIRPPFTTVTRFNRDFFVTPTSQEDYKVQQYPAGPSYTCFTILGAHSILVETSDRLQEQKEILEYLARYPQACFAKELHLDSTSRVLHGKYFPLEDYQNLLAEDIYVCKFEPGPFEVFML